MRTDTEIRVHGLRALIDVLGIVEAEKFISLILREPFDYTKWQQNLWPNKNVAEISKAAVKSRGLCRIVPKCQQSEGERYVVRGHS